MQKEGRTIKDFLEKKGLGKVLSVKRFNKGNINKTYLVETTSDLFSFRVYSNRTRKEIEDDIKLLGSLKGLPVPEPISLLRGKIFKFQNKNAVIYPYLEGSHLEEVTHLHLKELGFFIAEFHIRSKKVNLTEFRKNFYHLPELKIKKIFKKVIDSKVPYKNVFIKLVEELRENRLDETLPRGPIHVDLKPDNVLFKNDKLTGVIDFDNAYTGPLILDVAKAMVWFGIQKGDFDVDLSLHIYYSYNHVRPFTDLEKRELYKAIKFAFQSHVFMDYYMYLNKKTTFSYFKYIVNYFYPRANSFKLSKDEFYRRIQQ